MIRAICRFGRGEKAMKLKLNVKHSASRFGTTNKDSKINLIR